MVKHLSPSLPSGNDSHMSGFQVTLLSETRPFAEFSPLPPLLSDGSELRHRAKQPNPRSPALIKSLAFNPAWEKKKKNQVEGAFSEQGPQWKETPPPLHIKQVHLPTGFSLSPASLCKALKS